MPGFFIADRDPYCTTVRDHPSEGNRQGDVTIKTLHWLQVQICNHSQIERIDIDRLVTRRPQTDEVIAAKMHFGIWFITTYNVVLENVFVVLLNEFQMGPFSSRNIDWNSV